LSLIAAGGSGVFTSTQVATDADQCFAAPIAPAVTGLNSDATRDLLPLWCAAVVCTNIQAQGFRSLGGKPAVISPLTIFMTPDPARGRWSWRCPKLSGRPLRGGRHFFNWFNLIFPLTNFGVTIKGAAEWSCFERKKLAYHFITTLLNSFATMPNLVQGFFSGAGYSVRNPPNLEEIGNGDSGHFAHHE
jgi:hypothetical protein